MERYAVISIPDALQIGLAAPLLFFDKVIIPDSDYVNRALYEIEHPQVFTSSWDPEGDKTIAEVRLGLGYHLWPTEQPVGDWTLRPKALLLDLEFLVQQGVVTPVSKLSVAPSDLGNRLLANSFRNYHFSSLLGEQRIQIALQMAKRELVDVSTVRHRPDETALASVPTTLDKTHVVRFILRQVPVPPRDIPMQEILQFRNDSEAQAELSRLRAWITRATKDCESLAHFEDEYRALYEDYKRSLSRLSRTFHTSALGIIATVAAEIVDNLAQLKLGSAVKALFDWQSTVIELEEKTENVPGRELAYLKRIEEAFAK